MFSIIATFCLLYNPLSIKPPLSNTGFGFAVITDKVDLGNLMLLQLSSYRRLGRNFSVCDKVVSSGLVHISDVVLRRSTFFSPW